MMSVGIVAEYNPFHSGHACQIAETRRCLGETAVVAVMSGHWVQRGECALADKWTRTAMALRASEAGEGPDLVLELPTPWAISSAEGFARGAVAVLRATGVVDALSFGSESGDLAALKRIAGCLGGESYRAALRAELDRGISFAEARQRAAASHLGREAELLRGPNDSLGVEYLRAAGEEMAALAVPRQGAGHDAAGLSGRFASAAQLRELARQGRWEALASWITPGGRAALEKAGAASMTYIDRAVLARLRQMREEDFAALPDSGAAEGLPARMVRAAGRAGTLEEFYTLSKTRRYAHARIRRLALWAFLGLTAADRPRTGPAYLRVLGMNDRGRLLLKEMKRRASLPILTKPAHIKEMDGAAQRLFELECRATNLYGLCFARTRPSGWEYTNTPVIWPSARAV